MKTKPDFKEIYRSGALEYDRLVSAEDHEGNILRTLQLIRPLSGLNVVELGAGTGRLTNLLAPLAGQISYLDNSLHMLSVAAPRLARSGRKSCFAIAADIRRVPVRSKSADIVIAGWTIGHLTGWFPERWRTEIGYVLSEMKRLLWPGGTAIILETLGTGRSTPKPPDKALAAYYRWLERENGFKSRWTRTDYQFDSVHEACRSVAFFFGNDLAEKVVQLGSPIVPECTGIWWLTT